MSWLSGLKLPWAMAASIPVSFGLYGIAGWALAEIGRPFTITNVALFCLAATIIGIMWRLLVIAVSRWSKRRRKQKETEDDDPAGPDEGDGPEKTDGPDKAAEPDKGTDPDEADSGDDAAAPTGVAGKPAGGGAADNRADGTPETADAGKPAAAPAAASRVSVVVEPADAGQSDPVAKTEVVAGGPADSTHDRQTRSPLAGLIDGSVLDPVWLLPGAGVLVGIWLIASRALDVLQHARGGMNNIYQGWDVQWHANEVRYILDSGIASATEMGKLMHIEDQRAMFYPSGWHAGTAMAAKIAHITPVQAVNLSGILLPALLLPLAAALLAWRLVGNRGLCAQMAAGFAGILVAVPPVLYWVGMYVGAWPYLAAISMCGIVVALIMSVPAQPVRMWAGAWAFAGAVATHPSAATVIVLPLLLWWLTRLVIIPSKKTTGVAGGITIRLQDLALLAVTGLVGTLLVLPQIIAGMNQTGEVESFDATENVTRAESWQMAYQLVTRHAEFFGPNPWILYSGLIGGVIVLLWRGNVWGPLFYGLSLAITVNAIKPFDQPWQSLLATVGSLHYNTPHRLIMPVALLTVAASGIALAAGLRLLCGGWLKKYVYTTGTLAVVAALLAGWVIADRVPASIARVSGFALMADRNGRMVDHTDEKAWDWLARQPKAYDGIIVSDPADGSGWMYAYNGLPSLFRHYLWPDPPYLSATHNLFWYSNRLGEGNLDHPEMKNPADISAETLGATFIYVSPPSFWEFQKTNPDLSSNLWDTAGVTPVYRDMQVTIFAVNAAFTDEELDRMRAPGNSPEPLPPLVTRGQAGVADGVADAKKPYYHRPTQPLMGPAEQFHSQAEDEARKIAESLWPPKPDNT
nr:DUF6541 family protein [Corynebacterium mendelii]